MERDVEKFKTLAYFVIGAMAVVFAFTSVLVGLDYFKNNEERYEKFIEKIENIKGNFYTKEHIDQNVISSINDSKNKLDNFKKCLEDGGWNRCFKE